MTPEELQQDKDFMSATPADQHVYLSATDPEYKSASPEDQSAYLAHVTKAPVSTTAKSTSGTQEQPPAKGFAERIEEKAKGAGQWAMRPIIPKGESVIAAQEYASSVPTQEESKHPYWTAAKKGAAGAYGTTMEEARKLINPALIGTAALTAFTGGAAAPLAEATLAAEEAGPAAAEALPAAAKAAPYAMKGLQYAGRGLGYGMAAQGAKDVYEGGKEISKKGFTPETAEQTLEPAMNIPLGLAGGLHGTDIGQTPVDTAAGLKKLATAPVRGAARAYNTGRFLVPFALPAIGAFEGGMHGSPVSAMGGAAGGIWGGRRLKSFMPEASVTVGLPEAEANVRTTENAYNAAQKEFNSASKAREPYAASMKQGVPPPSEIENRYNTAKKDLAEATFHRDVAREALTAKPAAAPAPEEPVELTPEQKARQTDLQQERVMRNIEQAAPAAPETPLTTRMRKLPGEVAPEAVGAPAAEPGVLPRPIRVPRTADTELPAGGVLKGEESKALPPAPEGEKPVEPAPKAEEPPKEPGDLRTLKVDKTGKVIDTDPQELYALLKKALRPGEAEPSRAAEGLEKPGEPVAPFKSTEGATETMKRDLAERGLATPGEKPEGVSHEDYEKAIKEAEKAGPAWTPAKAEPIVSDLKKIPGTDWEIKGSVGEGKESSNDLDLWLKRGDAADAAEVLASHGFDKGYPTSHGEVWTNTKTGQNVDIWTTEPKPEMGKEAPPIPGDQTKAGKELVDAIADYHNTNRGFTYNPAEGGFVKGKPVFSVAGEHPELTVTIPGQNISPEDLRQYVERPDVQEALQDPKNSLGGWFHKGKSYLEISKLFDNRDEALAAGKRMGQEEIYDHANKVGIPVSGEAAPFKILGQEVPKPVEEKPTVNPEPATPRAPLDRAAIQGGEVAQPMNNYHEASQGKENPWVRRSADPANDASPTNEKRTLLVQFSSDLLNKDFVKDEASEYYDQLYSGAREGYVRMHDFWEIPQWMGFASHFLPDADIYVVRDMDAAKNFLNTAKYGHVAFSALDMNAGLIKELASSYEGKFDVGGYIAPSDLAGIDNIKWHNSMQDFAKDLGVPYKNGVDYRHFEGSDTIPRLTLSDGCLHKCAFCIVPKEIKMTDAAVVQQQADQIAKMGSKLVYINDKTYGQAKNFTQLAELNKQIKAQNPDFKGFVVQTTAAQLAGPKLTPEFLKDSGIKFVELGIESYNDPILKAMKKPATESLINKAVDKLRQAKIALIPNIIIGLPGETAETYAHTLDFLKHNTDMISHANIYNLALYKDAELGKQLTTASPADFNENVLEKSWMTNPEIHQVFAGDLYGAAKDMLTKNTELFPAESKAVGAAAGAEAPVTPAAVAKEPPTSEDWKDRGFTDPKQMSQVSHQLGHPENLEDFANKPKGREAATQLGAMTNEELTAYAARESGVEGQSFSAKGGIGKGAKKAFAETLMSSKSPEEILRDVQDNKTLLARMKGNTGAPDATPETAKMSNEDLLKHGFTQEEIDSGRHIPKVSGASLEEAVNKGIPESIAKYMTPEEIAGVTKSAAGTKSFLDKLAKLPSVQDYIDIARLGEGARKWYQRSSAAFDAMMKESPDYFKEGDRDKFIGLLAATSPQQSVAMNMAEALRTWKSYVDADRPTGSALRELLHQNVTLSGAKVPNAELALSGKDMWPDLSKNTSFKVPSFAKNLQGWLNYVTNDGWMGLFGGIEGKSIQGATSYHPLAVATRAAAEALGWDPAEAQAAIWSFTQALTESGGAIRTPEEVRAYSQDFVDILRDDPTVRELLQDLGVSHEQLDAKLAAIGEKPAVSGRTTPTTVSSIGELERRIEEIRGKGALPKSKQGAFQFREAPAHEGRTKAAPEEPDEGTEFNPKELEAEEKPKARRIRK